MVKSKENSGASSLAKRLKLRTPLDIPLVLFLLSGLVGIWASYDPSTSWLQFALLVGAVLLYSGIARLRGLRSGGEIGDDLERLQRNPLIIFICLYLLLCVLLVVDFVTQHSFSSDSKFSIISRIGESLNQLLPQLDLKPLLPNSVAAILEIALPLNIALIWRAWRRSRLIFLTAVLFALLFAFGLLMTSSRGAWLGLAAVGLILGNAYVFSRRRVLKDSSVIPLVFFVSLALVLFFVVSLVPTGWEDLFKMNQEYYGRLPLYETILSLMQGYFFTGGGMGTFKMVHSTYYLLIQGGLLPHAHSLYLQIWFDQGLLGIASFLWINLALFAYAWRQRRHWNAFAIAGLAGTASILVHGLTDAPFWYSIGSLLFLFVPIAVAIAALGEPDGTQAFFFDHRAFLAVGVAAVLVAAGLIGEWSPLVALWYANLGDVAQTKIELSRYSFPEVLVEYVRRREDYAIAEADWQQALAFDPGNVPANQRWAQVLLARGEYAHATQLLEAAYARDSTSPVTLQLLGAAYLGMGRLDDAYRYWVRLPDAVGRLESEAWVRYETNGDQERAGWATALARRILNEQSGKQ